MESKAGKAVELNCHGYKLITAHSVIEFQFIFCFVPRGVHRIRSNFIPSWPPSNGSCMHEHLGCQKADSQIRQVMGKKK